MIWTSVTLISFIPSCSPLAMLLVTRKSDLHVIYSRSYISKPQTPSKAMSKDATRDAIHRMRHSQIAKTHINTRHDA